MGVYRGKSWEKPIKTLQNDTTKCILIWRRHRLLYSSDFIEVCILNLVKAFAKFCLNQSLQD